LVMDEADRILDVSFVQDLDCILKCLPKKRQTLLFSATMTTNITKLSQVALDNAFTFSEASVAKYNTVEKCNQVYVFMPAKVKDCYLIYLVRKFLEADKNMKIIVFFFNLRGVSSICHTV